MLVKEAGMNCWKRVCVLSLIVLILSSGKLVVATGESGGTVSPASGGITDSREAGDQRLRQLFLKLPIFGQSVTLTAEEFAAAERWPVTKVLLYNLKHTRTYLVFFRSDVATGRTAAFFHWVGREPGWEEEFRFLMYEISDAYWVDERADPDVLPGHRVPIAAEILEATEGALAGGYLKQGLEDQWFVVTYTSGKSLRETRIAYPVIRLEHVADREGFVAIVGPPRITPEARVRTRSGSSLQRERK